MSKSVIFIIGGNAGIGLATALKFAEAGCDVSILRRRQAENEAAQKLVEQLGGINYAFNNAGIEQHYTPLATQTEDDYQRIIDTNVKGVWLCMQQQIPRMLEAGGGSIVNTGSGGFTGRLISHASVCRQ
jgi:NAD(P)-dependent dehydrogenase (short-subunit alcohol dehydrogenase family)